MASSREAVLARIRESQLGKLIRYSAVSAVAFPFTQILIWYTQTRLDWSGVASNAAAVALAAIPAYILNRYWVWGKKDKNRFWAEIVPFWALTFVGLAISTLFAFYADRWFDSPYAINLANALGFGIVWIFKFLILDRLMFGSHRHFPLDEDLDAALAEAGG